MKKNTIQNQAQYAENKILEDNADFYSSVKSKYYPNKTANKRIIILRLGSVAAVCLVVIICLSVILTKVLDNNNEKHYSLQNEKNTLSDLTELNDNLNDIFINIRDNEYRYLVTKICDSVSGDNLYFVINITGDDYFENIKIYFYVNPYYELTMKLTGKEIKTINVNGIDISYKENIYEDSDGLFNLNYIAQINDNKSVICVEYSQLWYENSTNFFNFLEQTIKNK